MTTEERLISADAFIEDIKTEIMNLYLDGKKGTPRPREELYAIIDRINEQPTVDAVPVDDIKLLHILIDNEGVPEVKLQIGDRYFILRTDPVDVREVVHSSWILNDDGSGTCKNCHRTTKNCWDYDSWMNYCPKCGAKMDGGTNNG